MIPDEGLLNYVLDQSRVVGTSRLSIQENRAQKLLPEGQLQQLKQAPR